jgi:hypothetical protein
VPEESVTVMLAFGRSRMTVSCWPEVVPLPAAPGRRGVGNGPIAAGVTCPGPVTGVTGVCPLFQFASVLQSPLLSFIQTAGMSWSFRNSTPP